MRPKVSLLLIRENAEQLTGSGCCGKLEGENAELCGGDLFGHSRRDQQDLGVLHRAVRQFFPGDDGREQVQVTVVDPRNQLYLTAKLVGDVLRYRPGWREGLRTAFQMFSLPAVVLNGRVLSRRDRPVDPDRLCHEVARIFERPIPAGAAEAAAGADDDGAR